MPGITKVDKLTSSSGITADVEMYLSYGGLDLRLTARNVVPTGKSSTEFIPTAADQTWTVPNGVIWIFAKLWGAGGGGGLPSGWVRGSPGGGGGHSFGLIPVTPGETLYIVVGLGGQTTYPGGQTPRYGGGGGMYSDTDNNFCGSGGGYTGIFRTSVSQANALLIAGGGGGGGSSRYADGNWGGGGGGVNGQQGNSPYDNRGTSGGGGGTQSAGGSAGATQATIGTAGSALTGGYGASNAYGGGGGGGYYGGGGGGYYETYTMAGGGGGSGYVDSSITFGQTIAALSQIPAGFEDNDLPKTIETYNNWAKYAWGGEPGLQTSKVTNMGGGGGYCKIYY